MIPQQQPRGVVPHNLVPSPAQELSTAPRLGASEAAACIGLNPYQGPMDIWLTKTGRKPAFAGNEKTRWGHVLEPVIRAAYVEAHGVTVWVPPTTLQHGTHPFITATPDGIVVAPHSHHWEYVAPQVKNVGLRQAQEWEAGIPEHYVIQAVVEMAVTQLPRLDFAVLVGGQEYLERTVHRDTEVEAAVLAALAEFWDRVQRDAPPEVDGSETYRKYLMERIRKADVIEAGELETALMGTWRDIVRQQAALDQELDEVQADLLAHMVEQNCAGFKSKELGTVSLSAPGTATLWKAVAESAGATPELIAQHTSPSARKFNRPRNWTK